MPHPSISRRAVLAAGLVPLIAAGLGGPALAEALAPVARRPRPRPALGPEALLTRARLGAARLGALAVDLGTGAQVLAHDPQLALPPASTLKTVTALYALDRLGEGHRFATRILRAGDTLILAGGGDPELDSDALATLAADTARAVGDWRPARFAVWEGALPRLAEIAPGQAAQLAYNPAVSGIILNFNRVHLGWRCESACTLSLTARAARAAPRAYGITAATRPGGGAWRVAAEDGTPAERWEVPRAALGASGSRWLPVRRPGLYAGDVFQTLARAAGLPLPAPEMLDALPGDAAEIARRDSRPLAAILRGMLEFSTNLTAEVVGLAASGAPDLRVSAQAMGDWARRALPGAPADAGGVVFEDHSGLGAGSRISPAALVALLARPDSAARLRPLLNRDPLAEALGREGGGDGAPGRPLVEAKTGTLNFVSNLAGYARGPDGAERAFAVMVADLPRRAATEGQELPEGVLGWTARAKRLQRDVVTAACAGAEATGPLPPEI